MRLLFLAGLLASRLYAIDCQHPENSAEQAICAHPELRELDRQIGKESAALKLQLTGENAAILSDSEMPFLRQRDDCSNEPEVPGCLRKVLAQRQALLAGARNEPNFIRQAIGQAYYIDVGFLRKYWRQLAGRKLSVYGCLMPDDVQKTHAVLEAENQTPVPLVFKSMPDEIADFLDDQKPCSQWLVTVEKQGETFALHADEVLGRPLP